MRPAAEWETGGRAERRGRETRAERESARPSAHPRRARYLELMCQEYSRPGKGNPLQGHHHVDQPLSRISA
jgi:hypothetical protein